MLRYGVATVSRIDSIIGLFCRISSLLQGSFAKETYDLIDPTNQSHSISSQFESCFLSAVSRIDRIIGLFCRMSSLLQGSFALKTYVLKKAQRR